MTEPTFSEWEPPPGPLYHYTNANALVNILYSKTIWATNMLYFNDAQEYNYAVKLLTERIHELKPTHPSAHLLFQDIERTLANTDPDRKDSSNPPGIYVASFAYDCGHDLNQWRAYAPNGNACSIGFDFRSNLRNVIQQQGFRLIKCEYDPCRQRELIDHLLHQVLNKLDPELTDSDPTQLGIKLYDKFLALAPSLKDQDFSAEREWRLISKPITASDIAPRFVPPIDMKSDKMKFRPGKATMIPYVEISLAAQTNPLSLHEIWIGPTPYPFLSRNAVQIAAIATGCQFQTGRPVRIWDSSYRAGGSQI